MKTQLRKGREERGSKNKVEEEGKEKRDLELRCTLPKNSSSFESRTSLSELTTLFSCESRPEYEILELSFERYDSDHDPSFNSFLK